MSGRCSSARSADRAPWPPPAKPRLRSSALRHATHEDTAMEHHHFTVSLSQQDWSLHRKGPADQARHNGKVKEAIRDNLADIISEQSIITSDGKKIVKVPIRSLEEYKFRFGEPPQGGQVGQGEGGSQVGDVIGRTGKPGQGNGPGAGEQPGIDYYEAELTVDDLAGLVFADLSLPHLEPKRARALESET